MKNKKALIVGASGLVGHELLNLLLDGNKYSEVTALVRSPIQINHSKLKEVVIDFNYLGQYKDFMQVDDVYCCLGTTIKKAGTKQAMYKVDVEYPIEIAKLTYEAGANQYLLVSSMNANAQSPIWYSKMKGELEQKLMKIPFSSIAIVRPSLLMGERKEFRLGEKVAEKVYKALSFIFIGPLKKYRAIEGKTVALAMYKIAQTKSVGVKIYPSEVLEKMVKG